MPGPTILAYDGSPAADAAIRAAAASLAADAAIVVTAWVSVLFAGPLGFGNPHVDPDVDASQAERARSICEHGADVAREAGFQAVSARAEHADNAAWATILAVADEVDASVIVVGARGLSTVSSALLGSVSHAIAQHARRPVLIVPPAAG